MNQSISIDFDAVIQAVVDAGLMQSTVTIQQPSGALTSTGAPDGTYTNVTGLVNLQCMDAPENTGSSFSVWEKSEPDKVESFARRHVLLNGYYPELSPSTNWGDVGWRAVVTSSVDGEHQTRLSLRKVTV